MLRVSHIVGWAEDSNLRGLLTNVILLCANHDAAFENGLFVIDDGNVVMQKNVTSFATFPKLRNAIRNPEPEFLRRHAEKHKGKFVKM